MYFLTSFICYTKTIGLEVKSEEALKDTVGIMKMIFTPINAMIIVSAIGNVFGKAKDQIISTDKAGKRLIIVIVAFILILVYESNYIGRFITELLG